MIYQNLFKKGKSEQSKNDLFFLKETAKYNLTIKADKNIIVTVSIGIGCIIGVFLLNAGVYKFLTLKNASHVEELSKKRSNIIIPYMQKLEDKISSYNNTIAECESIYKLDSQSTQWSNILVAVTSVLPYDTVLTKVETIDIDNFYSYMEGEDESNESGNENNNTDENSDENSNENTDENTDENSNENTDENSEESTDENTDENGEKKEKEINPKNILLIEGKTPSIVNMSLFLEMLNKSDEFSRAEYKSVVSKEGYFEFQIFIFLNKQEV